MGVTSCATLPFLPGTHVFSTVFKLLQANSTLFKHLWLVTLDENGEAVSHLLQLGRKGKVTLLYSAKNTEHNEAAALRDYLLQRSAS